VTLDELVESKEKARGTEYDSCSGPIPWQCEWRGKTQYEQELIQGQSKVKCEKRNTEICAGRDKQEGYKRREEVGGPW
jgi:hypothetical protein